MEMDDAEVRALWRSTWGAERRSPQQILPTGEELTTPALQAVVEFHALSPSGKIQVAENLIEECTHPGGGLDSGDVAWFLTRVADDIQTDGHALDDRRVPSLRSAMQLVARTSTTPENRRLFAEVKPNWIREVLVGGVSLAVPYLLGQLEFLFRVHSLYLKSNGNLDRPFPKVNATRKSGSRVNQIGEAMEVFVFRNRLFVAGQLRAMEKRNGLSVRLNSLRHPIAHGSRGDASFDVHFVALMYAMLYYGTHGVKPRAF